MKILMGFHYHPHPLDVREMIRGYCSRLGGHGVEIECFPITLNPPGPKLSWPQLDELWKRGDATLLRMYEDLARRLEDFDVLLNWGAYNLHPDFLSQIKMPKVCAMFDDPEQWDAISSILAPHYDLSLVGNAAEVERYHKAGLKAEYWPLGFQDVDYVPSLTKRQILEGTREVDLTILCERYHPWRRERLDKISAAFPRGSYYGQGWPRGFLPEEDRLPLLQNSKIGINLHNSTGPLNSRTFVLPANGVMQICDNKSHLHKVFEVGKEIVGYDTAEEAIELCRYYLDHDGERRQIAAAGWERSVSEYNEGALGKKAVELIAKHCAIGGGKESLEEIPPWLETVRREPARKQARLAYQLGAPVRGAKAAVSGARKFVSLAVKKALGQKLA